MLFRKAATQEKDRAKEKEKKEYRIVRYFKEVRAEIGKVVWPSRKHASNLALIVLGVMAAMSIALGLIDWIFGQLFALIIG